MNLRIGILSPAPVWEQILLHEGVPYAFIDLSEGNVSRECSVLIVSRQLAASEHAMVEEYLHHGGAVLGFAEHLLYVFGTATREEQLEYLLPHGETVLDNVHLIDLGVSGRVPREANTLRTQAGTLAAFAGTLDAGHAVMLPFHVEDAFNDWRIANKNFYYSRERTPSERVSLVGKAEVQHMIHASLQYLHLARGLPYVHLWYFPDGRENIFAFRIDTDGASRTEIMELYDIARAANISLSWFIDVKSHEQWLREFTYMREQEIGVHCYEHQTYTEYEPNLRNLARAKQGLTAIGLQPGGFASPFGTWNPALARVIDELEFAYSSEFGFAYDAFPLYPVLRGIPTKALQVPIHPVSIGSLRRVGYSTEHMIGYYRMIVDRKLQRGEPLFFYHHPSHELWEVVRFIFDYVASKSIANTTLGNYARWWRHRLSMSFKMMFSGHTLEIEGERELASAEAQGVFLHITDGRREILTKPAAQIDFQSLGWRQQVDIPGPPEDIGRIREFDPRTALGDLYNTILRKRR